MTQQNTTILVTRKGMGQADPELQITLMQSYLRTLNEAPQKPVEICFYAEGVHLVVEGSPVVHLLKLLADKGVRLTVCSTCLSYYDLLEQVAVGSRGTMVEIVEAQMQAEKVITI